MRVDKLMQVLELLGFHLELKRNQYNVDGN